MDLKHFFMLQVFFLSVNPTLYLGKVCALQQTVGFMLKVTSLGNELVSEEVALGLAYGAVGGTWGQLCAGV